MTAATSLRSLVLAAVAKPPPAPKDTPQGRNVLLHPIGTPPPAEKPTITEGTLDYAHGGHDVTSKRERVYALLGPGATVFGVATVIEPFVNFASGTQKRIPTDSIARAIVKYNEAFIEPPAAKDYRTWPAWRVGMRVPLPLEIVSASEWIVNRDAITALDGGFGATLSRHRALLELPAVRLEIPDPKALREEQKQLVAAATNTPATLGEGLADALLVNPYEPVFRALELMRQLAAASRLPFALTVVGRLDDRQANGLARTTGGAVVLRRLWETLANAGGSSTALQQARARVAAALGLVANAGEPGGFESPRKSWPSVTPLELPDPVPAGRTRQAEVAPRSRGDEDPLGMQAMVLGRQLCIGNTASTKQSDGTTWSGPSYAGRVSPVTFANDPEHAAEIGASATPAFAAARHLVLEIADNEGWLDAVRAADAGLISTGVQQWSAHSNKELPVVLARFKELAPDHYDAFFGLYGLDARMWAPASADPNAYANDMDDTGMTEAARKQKIDAANPDWDATTPYGTKYPSYCSLWNLDPRERPEETPFPEVGRMGLTTFPPKPAEDPRSQFFGARHPRSKDGTANTKLVEVGGEWAARFRLVALCSIPYRVNQLQLACYRIRRIERELPKQFTLAGRQHTFKQLASSQFAAAAVLDAHINFPWNDKTKPPQNQVARDLEDAATRTPGTPHDASNQLRDEWLLRFRVNYLADRWVYGKKHRDGTIIAKHDAPKGLSATSGTFTTWE